MKDYLIAKFEAWYAAEDKKPGSNVCYTTALDCWKAAIDAKDEKALHWFPTTGSSNVKSIRMDGKDLLVQFRAGDMYRYFDVPKEKFTELCMAESVGSYLNKSIKPHYKFEKVVD